MTEAAIDWNLVDRLLQYVVIPALAWVWALQKQTTNHEKILLRIETMLDERQRHRDEDKKEFAEAIRGLNDTIKELRADIVRVAEAKR